jgi:hypothetical protein
MIRYKLKCDKTDEEFEGWFSNSGDFDHQKERGILECPCCGGRDVSKALMAPAVNAGLVRAEQREAAEEVARMRAYIKENCNDVGSRFAEEVRALESADKRTAKRAQKRHAGKSIVGEATPEEAQELAREGISFSPLPPGVYRKYDA